jgi:hypothetical protein
MNADQRGIDHCYGVHQIAVTVYLIENAQDNYRSAVSY